MAQRSVIEAKHFCLSLTQHYFNSDFFSCVYFGLQIDWAANIRKTWDFSEGGAQARLEAFLHDGETPFYVVNKSHAVSED